jgi:uncharacterized protein with von Willebrand factor type A (vWA) domain
VSGALVRDVVTFGRILREAGLEVGPGRIADALQGLDHVGVTRQDDVYWTLRTTLVARREELEPFDRAFDAWFLGRGVAPPRRPREDPRPTRQGPRLRRDAQLGRPADQAGGDPEEIGHSSHEVLRTKDFAAMTPAEASAARELLSAIVTERPTRRSHRLEPHRRGTRLHMRALMRASLATAGEPIDRRYRRRRETPRKLVLLCDVSGSMEAYSRALLLFMHATVRSGRSVEVFAFGTRLTRLTPDLRARDPDEALSRAAASVVDWAAGTRIGASLKEYNDVWGRRALTRGSVVVIASDGWERQDHELLGREMRRLHRAAHAVVWVNPLKGSPEYQPLGAGMREALPHVDRFVSGHNVASLESLSQLLTGLRHRHQG